MLQPRPADLEERTRRRLAPQSHRIQRLLPGPQQLDFAVVKILGHRGISANRSVDRLREYAWLMGRDDLMSAMDAAEFPQYGAPIVKAFADAMGWPFGDPGDEVLARMASGEPCTDGCEEGCGQ